MDDMVTRFPALLGVSSKSSESSDGGASSRTVGSKPAETCRKAHMNLLRRSSDKSMGCAKHFRIPESATWCCAIQTLVAVNAANSKLVGAKQFCTLTFLDNLHNLVPSLPTCFRNSLSTCAPELWETRTSRSFREQEISSAWLAGALDRPISVHCGEELVTLKFFFAARFNSIEHASLDAGITLVPIAYLRSFIAGNWQCYGSYSIACYCRIA